MFTNTVAQLPVFNGSNFNQWMEAMWLVVTEEEPKPADAASDANNATKAGVVKVQKEWAKEDMAATRAITMKLQEDLHIHMKNSAAATWKHLETTFGKVKQAEIYGWFQELMAYLPV